MRLPPGFSLDRLSAAEQDELIALIEEDDRYRSRRLFYAMFPAEDTIWDGADNKDFKRGATIYARHKYPKHLEFFEAGAKYRERCFMAANRVSKTLGGGGYETACHLTGLYPDWWPGYRFAGPTRIWAAGKKLDTTRDIVQATLMGDVKPSITRKGVTGTGVIPGDLIGDLTWRQGVPDLIDTARIRHVTGGWSLLGLKSYEQGSGSFEGTAQDAIWFDEEPDEQVYDEALIRTMTTRGLIYLTFTPLLGISAVVKAFLPTPDLAA